jgi:hypothetical protein
MRTDRVAVSLEQPVPAIRGAPSGTGRRSVGVSPTGRRARIRLAARVRSRAQPRAIVECPSKVVWSPCRRSLRP